MHISYILYIFNILGGGHAHALCALTHASSLNCEIRRRRSPCTNRTEVVSVEHSHGQWRSKLLTRHAINGTNNRSDQLADLQILLLILE